MAAIRSSICRRASQDALFRKAKEKAALPAWTFHDTRHEAITRLARFRRPLDLARMTGHTNPAGADDVLQRVRLQHRAALGYRLSAADATIFSLCDRTQAYLRGPTAAGL
jgi:integrase